MKTTEYLMIRRLEEFKTDSSIQFEQSEDETDGITVRIHRRRIPFGSFRLLPYSCGDVYFYDFSLFPENRGHGLGTRVFPLILNYLYLRGYKNIRLQVSSSNPAALSLYKHYDFTILESV